MRFSTQCYEQQRFSTLPCLRQILTSDSSEAHSPTTTLAVVFSYVPSTILRFFVAEIWKEFGVELVSLLHLCNRMMSKSKSDYYTSLLSNNSANPRHMWNSVNTIPHREKSKPLPYYTSLDTLGSSFSSKFFTDKITRIRSNFVKNDHSRDFPEPPHVENTMDQFTHTTTSEVRSIILKSTNASCDLDPFPTRLLKHYWWSDCTYHSYH